MITIQENVPLASFTSFHIGGSARYFATIQHKEELLEAFNFAEKKHLLTLILGSGSNMLISDAGFDGLVFYLEFRGIKIVSQDGNFAYIRASAGERWDDLVGYTVNQRLWGIENLSLIPGSVGASPVQNIGAYGQEVSSVIDSIEAFDINAKKIVTLDKEICHFGYRSSVFNTTQKGRYIITALNLRLSKHGKSNLDYGDLRHYFSSRSEEPSLRDIRDAVISIRKEKLPNPKEYGNAGSFFKNLELTKSEYEILEKNIENNFGQELLQQLHIVTHRINTVGALESNAPTIKIPTAFLIDNCGLKNAQVGGATISERQPLVIVNKNGDATAHDVMTLFKKVRTTVFARTGMKVENEPQLIGFEARELEEYFDLER